MTIGGVTQRASVIARVCKYIAEWVAASKAAAVLSGLSTAPQRPSVRLYGSNNSEQVCITLRNTATVQRCKRGVRLMHSVT